jgi:hypothetical protein
MSIEPTARFVSIDELAKTFDVSIPTVRSWVRLGHIPDHTYVKIAKTYRFDIEKLKELWFNASKATNPIVEPANTKQLQLELVVDPDKDL